MQPDTQRRSRIAGLLLALATACATASPNAEQAFQAGIQSWANGDIVTAMMKLREAAEAGHAKAQARLAFILDDAEENEEAFRYASMSAEQGDPEGMFHLYKLYATGEGTGQKEPGKALRWLQASADAGWHEAYRALGAAWAYGQLGLKADGRKAAELWETCAQEGDPVCARNLQDLYTRGAPGVQPDPALAQKWKDWQKQGKGPES